MPTAQIIEANEGRPSAPARAVVTELAISGMTCGNCARHVTEALQGVPGVRSATVSLEASSAAVRWDAAADPNIAAAIAAVQAEGFGAAIVAARSLNHVESLMAGWQLNLWVGVPALAVLMVGEWAIGLGMTPWFQWLAFGLAGLVQAIAGARFYRGAWGQLKAGNSNMDTLVALGSTTAFGYSTWALLSRQGGHVYFMEAAAIITLISVGHWMESRVSVRASSALRGLLNLAPARARQRLPDGTETEIPVAELRVGALVALRPGDRIPTDGEVVEGNSVVDESMLTGESSPIDKTAGSQLYAGTANVNGRLLIRVTALGEETALAHIIAAVQRAQTSRAGIQRIGDRISSIFVPIVATVAVAAGLWWGLAPASARQAHDWVAQFLWAAEPPNGQAAAAFIIAAAVLIIACPCAMGLATPAAIMAGSNAAARRGILIRDGVALEKAGHVTAVLFDKTGTLTLGKPEVVGALDLPITSNASALAPGTTLLWDLTAALTQHSTHPISQALARRPRPPEAGLVKPAGSLFELNDWREVHGAGVQATVPPMLPSQTPGSRSDKASSSRRNEAPDGTLSGLSIPDGALDSLSPNTCCHPVKFSVPSVSCPPLLKESLSEARGGQADEAKSSDSLNSGSGDLRRVSLRGQVARLGSLRWLGESGVDLSRGDAFHAEWSAQGATVVGLALDHLLLALFAVKDTLKPRAKQVVAQLHRQGYRTYLVTGDNPLTAASIARQAGISSENVFAEVRPEQKAQFVQRLQRQGQRVAFVGDGINDAPALEQADLGVAVSRASDIAREAADIILLKSEIEAVPESLGLARATLRTIRQNLFWAFFYNAVGIPLAALGFMSPILCAAAMGLSDLVVIGNALRLRRWRL